MKLAFRGNFLFFMKLNNYVSIFSFKIFNNLVIEF